MPLPPQHPDFLSATAAGWAAWAGRSGLQQHPATSRASPAGCVKEGGSLAGKLCSSAWSSCSFVLSLREVMIVMSVFMAVMHEQMHQRAGEKEKLE